MAAPSIPWREPDNFVAGDTLYFQRSLPSYSPADGWAIHLVVTQNVPNGAKKVADAISTPDATNSYHVFNVPNFCAGLDAGTYILTEEVTNAAGNVPLGIAVGTRFQIYHDDEFGLQDNLADGLATGPVQTEAQIILAGLYDTYKQLLKLKFAETEDLRSRFRLQDQSKILEDIKYWEAKRMNERQCERARNGQRPGNVQDAVFAI